ncbi:hypothetical protein MYSTI_03611 [Myxococcus stipitatus DSM 14675]|uniref:SH3b domain-containing protein n=1 Tax=Myxococcus stipitatus (strain DSM 14675 / JCM 12634 / Mx s8) TaxID=1278073 RepID=L7UBI4_MYXSD|nr:SH3 domain-containing protein [Myxococcus stipitatus]AGC44917.1 hypothetical protein MYSTI_03611 [Myxococcus stipitatus DSM 14675]
MTPALLLSLLLAQSEAPSLHYTAFLEEEAGPRTLESYDFTQWEPAEKKVNLFVGVDEANLRQTASADAPVVTTLPLGAAVRVVSRGKDRLKVGEYVNHWYSVEYTKEKQTFKGWLFGNTLTPFRFEADFDGDGEKEVATVVMSNDFKIRIRFMEPKAKPSRRVTSVDVMPAGQSYLNVDGGPVVVKLIAAKVAGVTLLQVDSKPEACSDYKTTYVSYQVPENKPGVLGQAKNALDVAGLSDPPNVSSYEVTFQSGAKELTVVHSRTEEDEAGKEKKSKERERYGFRDGVYAELKADPPATAETQP